MTNAEEVEQDYRLVLGEDDRGWLEPSFDEGRGGRVRVHRTEPLSPAFMHVPQSNPFVTKLAGLATEVVREQRCEVIFSYYLEPYGLAAHLCSAWTSVPYVVRNAGSDLGRLMHRRGVGAAYREVYRRADGVCSGSPYPLIGLGVAPERLYPAPRPGIIRRYFNPAVPPLDLATHVAEAARAHPELVPNKRSFDPSLPVIGAYGKMGVAKGSFDLLMALGALRREGVRFSFVALTRGRKMASYLKAIEEQGLSDVTWVLPFTAHWNVGRFLRACTAVCFLERDFPIAFHTPTVPREVLASGTCLILSGEIAQKQALRDRLVTGENVLIVPDPREGGDLRAALRRVIEDPALPRAIDRAALVEWATFRHMLGERTLLRGISQVPPGGILEVTRGAEGVLRLRAGRHSQPRPVELPEREAELVDLLCERLSASVRAQAIADHPVGAFLSGGLDSAVLVALMAGGLREPLHTFSIGDDPASADLDVSRRLAACLGVEHHEIALDPEALVEALPMSIWALEAPTEPSIVESASPSIRRHVKAALCGGRRR